MLQSRLLESNIKKLSDLLVRFAKEFDVPHFFIINSNFQVLDNLPKITVKIFIYFLDNMFGYLVIELLELVAFY